MKRISLFVIVFLSVCSCCIFNLEVALAAQSPPNSEEETTAQSQNKNLISLDFKDAGLKDVLKVFSQQSGLNFIAGRNVEDKPITLYMENVSVEDALQTLLTANNLALEQQPESNIIIVKGQIVPEVETITKVYKFRYFHGIVPVGQYLMAQAKDTGGGGGGGKTGGTGIKDFIKPLLSKYGVITELANLAVITDVPERFKLIDQVIAELDKPIPETMLEVELIETTADFLKNLGVKWSKEFARYAGPARLTPIPYTPWNRKDLGKAESPLSTQDAFFRYGLISSTGLTWILEMLSSDTNTKFLAKPRILVQNREWAEIKITSNQVVSVKTTVTSEGGSSKTQTEAERMEVGTILRVLPMINEEEGYVSLILEPSVSRAQDSTFTAPDGTSFINPLERSLRTVVMVRDNETVAIGGFITTEDMSVQTKVPWVGDIPFLGAFFKHNQTLRLDKELLIFITPKIVSPTHRVSMQVSDTGEEKKQPPQEVRKDVQPKVEPEEKQPAVTKPATVLPISEEKKELPFREQEDFVDFKIDLTLKSSNLGVVDLVK